MMTKLSRIDSSSNSLKYSIMTFTSVSMVEGKGWGRRGGRYLNNCVEKQDDFDGV